MKNITGGSTYWIACCDGGGGMSVTAYSCDEAEDMALSVCGSCYGVLGAGCNK